MTKASAKQPGWALNRGLEKSATPYERNSNRSKTPASADTQAAIAEVRSYMAKSGLSDILMSKFVGYAPSTFRHWVHGRYSSIVGDDSVIKDKLRKYMALHPVGETDDDDVFGVPYETENFVRVRHTFRDMLERPQAGMIYAPPGSQKTFAVKQAIRDLNRDELPKNGHGRRAFYVYCRPGLRPMGLMQRIAHSAGVHSGSSVEQILLALRHAYRGRRVLFCLDEAHELDIRCLNTVRELLDQPPNASLLFFGSHRLREMLDQHASVLEQVNSRITKRVLLPGCTDEEARGIIEREVGELLRKKSATERRRICDKMIRAATVRDAFEKGREYINVRTLTNALLQVQQAQKAGH